MHIYVCVSVSVCTHGRSVASNSLRPHGLGSTRLFCPWNSPGKNTGVDSHFFPPGDVPQLAITPASPVAPALAGRFFTTEPPGKSPSTVVWKFPLFFNKDPPHFHFALDSTNDAAIPASWARLRIIATCHGAPGPVLNILLVVKLPHPPPPQAYTTVAGVCISCILEMRTPGHREVRPLVKGHRARTWQDRGPSGPPGPGQSSWSCVLLHLRRELALSESVCAAGSRGSLGFCANGTLLGFRGGTAPFLGGSDSMLSLEGEL